MANSWLQALQNKWIATSNDIIKDQQLMDKNGLTYTTKSCKTIFLYNSFKKKKRN